MGTTEIWADGNVGTTYKYTTNTQAEHKTFTTKDEELIIHFFSEIGAQRTTPDYSYFRHAINTPTEDEVAPVIVADDVEIDENETGFEITFGTVTADDEYFFYIADEEHGIAEIALEPTITVAKTTEKNGITYNYKCYAVDYNGNMSTAYAEFSYTAEFDPTLNLALNKPSYCGYQQGDGVRAEKANNGNKDDFWTSFGGADPESYWWMVDLCETYDVDSVYILFNDNWGTNDLLYSADGETWKEYATGFKYDNDKENDNDIAFNTKVSARYFKLVSSVSQIGIKEFEVYATGVTEKEDPTPTAIEQTVAAPAAMKMVRNGQVVILRGGILYNVNGQVIK